MIVWRMGRRLSRNAGAKVKNNPARAFSLRSHIPLFPTGLPSVERDEIESMIQGRRCYEELSYREGH